MPHNDFSATSTLNATAGYELECLQFMQDRGFNHDHLIFDERMHRFSGRADDKRKTEWYIASRKMRHDGTHNVIVTFNSHHDSLKQDKHYVFVSKMTAPITREERDEEERQLKLLQERTKRRKQRDKERRQQIAAEARTRFEAASPFGTSSYLERKQVGAHGVRFEIDQSSGETNILVPLRDIEGIIHSLQIIYPSKRVIGTTERDKYFLPGGQVKGCFHVLGNLTNGDVVYEPIQVKDQPKYK